MHYRFRENTSLLLLTILEPIMNRLNDSNAKPNDEILTTTRYGKVKYALAMWLLGLPLPIIIIALFVGGCDF
jgi:thiamine monophosphate kinase